MSSAAAGQAERFEALDGWRGVCACLVALLHFHGYSPLYSSSLVRNAYLFVDFFFVLSGFVIAHTYGEKLGDRAGVRRFLILRLGRVYPLHVAVLLFLVAYETLRLLAHADAFTGGHQPTAVLTNLLLVQSLNLHDQLTWNGPSWSISTELWTYVLFALVAVWLGMRNWMIVATAIVAPLLLFHLSHSGMDTTYDWGFIRCVFGFALGVACHRLHRLAHRVAPAPSAATMTLLEIAIVAAVIAFVCSAGTSALSFMAPFVFAVAVLIFAMEGGWVSQVFRGRLLQWLGKLSYSIYLTHYVVVLVLPPIVKRVLHADLWTAMPLPGGQYVMAFGRNPLEGTALYALVLLATLALSALTFRWIEVPGREWTRRWLARSRGAAPQGQPQRS